MRPSVKKHHVHIVHAPPDHALRTLRKGLDPAIELSIGMDEVPPSASILVTGRPTREQIRTCTGLQALIIPFAGVPDVTRDLILGECPDLPVYNLHHNAAAAAELAVALLMAAAKRLLPVDRAFRQGDWRSRYEGATMTLLEGRTVLVLGLGAIGARVAKVCRGLGMRVQAVRRHPDRPVPAFVDAHPVASMPELLPATDVLIVSVPLTSETKGMIGGREIALLPESAIIVNIARGPVIDERALYTALRDGRLAAAGLDVWYRYPSNEDERSSLLPSEYPFHELDTVVMSPHRGGAFRLEELEERRMRHLAATLNAIASGEAPLHRVDLEAGHLPNANSPRSNALVSS